MTRTVPTIFAELKLPAFLVGIILFTVCCAEPGANQQVELKFSISLPARHQITTDAFEVWGDRVEKATSNRVKITFFPGDTLISPKTAYEAVKMGACDIAMLIQSYEPNRFPMTMVMNLPLDFPDAIVSSKVAWEIYQKFPEIQEEYKDVKLLFLYTTSAYQFHTPTTAIRKKDDLAGLLIRVGGPVDKAIVEALKGIPEFMHMPDTYLALSKGVLDVHMSPFGPMKGLRTAEVTSFHTGNANLHMSVFGAIMNLDKWNALRREDRQAIEEVSGSKAAELFGGVFEKLDKEAITFMKEKGDTFLHLSKTEKSEWRELLDVIVADWVKEQEKRGRPAQKILDSALRFRDKHLSQYSGIDELKNSMTSFYYHK